MRGAWLFVAACLATCVACDGEAPADAGVDEDAGAVPFTEPTPPTAPAPPCAPGWDDCTPPGSEACPDGQARFGDRTACAPIGGACPSGDWPDPLPEGTSRLFVRPGGSGDGTMGAPFGSIERAIRMAPAGAVVVLAKGTYDESFDIFADVAVVGACATETIIAPSSGSVAAVAMFERNARLENVTVRGGDLFGIDVLNAGAVLRDVMIDGADGTGLTVREAGALEADRLVIRGVTGRPMEAGFAVAMLEAEATFRSISIVDNAGAAIFAEGEGTQLDVTGLYAARNELGVPGARTVSAHRGATGVVRGGVVEQIDGAAFYTEGPGSSLAVEDVVVRDFSRESGMDVGGFVVRDAANLSIARVDVADGVGFGLIGLSAPGDCTVEDLRVRDIRAGTTHGGGAMAWNVAGDFVLTMRRVSLEDTEGPGLLAGGGEFAIEDVSLVRVGQRSPTAQIAMGFGADATLRAERVSITEGSGAALLIDRGVRSAELTDLRVADPLPRTDGQMGRAVELQAPTTLSRAVIERGHEAGIYAVLGSSITLTDVHIRDTRARACAESTCPDTPGGHGLLVTEAEVTARRFVIDQARLCGAMVAQGGMLDLRDGEIRGAAIGACVQVDGYDTSRLTDGVAFVMNGINLDATDHALPTPSDPLP